MLIETLKECGIQFQVLKNSKESLVISSGDYSAVISALEEIAKQTKLKYSKICIVPNSHSAQITIMF